MVNYVLLAAVLTIVWIIYAALRVGPWCAKHWKASGEFCGFLAFAVGELLILVVFLRFLGGS